MPVPGGHRIAGTRSVLSRGNGRARSALVGAFRSEPSDPDHLEARNGVVVAVLNDDRHLLHGGGGSHEGIENGDPSPAGAQGCGDAGELARHLGIDGKRVLRRFDRCVNTGWKLIPWQRLEIAPPRWRHRQESSYVSHPAWRSRSWNDPGVEGGSMCYAIAHEGRRA